MVAALYGQSPDILRFFGSTFAFGHKPDSLARRILLTEFFVDRIGIVVHHSIKAGKDDFILVDGKQGKEPQHHVCNR